MLGMGPLIFRHIVGDRAVNNAMTLGTWPAPMRRAKLQDYHRRVKRYYAVIDRITWLHNNRITTEEFTCAAAPLL